MGDKTNQTPQDFEMGGENQKPNINKYTSDVQAPAPKAAPTSDQAKVNPKGAAPNKAASPMQEAQDAATREKMIKAQVARKKAALGCLGAFGSVMMILIVLSFIFISLSGEGETNPIAALLGIDQAAFMNGLITSIHVLFIFVALTTFVFTMVGLFKASMAKKDDKVAKKSGLKMSMISGALLIFVFIIWMFVYVYLDGKRIDTDPNLVEPIVTTPEETLNLTAPIEIRFDATNVPVNTRKFQIISYGWDFGDGEKGTNSIVDHVYESKGTNGRYDVVLAVTRRDKATGEEFQDLYSEIVSIANEALSAILLADPQSGEAPLEVKFDASDSSDPDGRIDRYEWDFNEDGLFDDAQGAEAKYEFEKIGRYTVSLRVVSSTGEYNIAEKEIIVEKQVLPEAVVTVTGDPEVFEPGVQYIFKGEDSVSPNGDIEEYEWDFGDGTQFEDTRTVAHTYELAGTYELVLKVVDEEEEEGELRKTMVVGFPEQVPVALIVTTPEFGDGVALKGKVPFKINFDGTGSTDADENIIEYQWDFDSNGTVDAFGAEAGYAYDEIGNYTATLTVIDSEGNEGTSTIAVEVEDQGVLAVLTADKTDGTIPVTVDFDASGSTYQDGSISSYKWNFGDGSKEKLGNSSISHKYTGIGAFTATVTVIGSDNEQATADIIVTVRETPLSACFTSVFDNGTAPLTTTFDPSCSTGTVAGYFWEFGDGGTATEVKPRHTFGNPGEYTVTLEISDSDNTIDTYEKIITVTE